MTWIETIRMREATSEQRAALRDAFRCLSLYPPEYGARVPALQEAVPDDSKGGISASHTLIPDALYHAFALYGSLLSPDLPLSRTQHEMIATTVSVLNACFYWTESHAEFLRLASGDDALAQAVKTDYRQANLTPADRAMLDYVRVLTLRPSDASKEAIDNLRRNGFDDRAILQINLIAAYFAYINRVADGLGVGRPG